MPEALTLIPAVLVLVFVAGGASKLGRRDLVSTALENFRLPALLQHPIVAIVLPVAELLLGLALFAARGWMFTVAAVTATLVTAVFVFIVARALSRGDRFDCGCFGATVSTPISGPLLIRNLLLLFAGIGSTALGASGFEGIVPELGSFTANDAAWVAVSAFLAGLTLTVFGARASTPAVVAADTMGARRSVLSPGDTIPDMHLDTFSGTSSRILDSIADRPHLLVFAKAGCRSCHTLLQQSAQIMHELGPTTGMLLLVFGDAESFEAEHPRLAPYALYGAGALAVRLGISSYPAGALLSPDGTLLSAPASGGAAIHALAASTSDRSSAH